MARVRIRLLIFAACVAGFALVHFLSVGGGDPVLSIYRNSQLAEHVLPTSIPAAPDESIEEEETDEPLEQITRPQSIAISTTILSPDSNFPVWLDYHLRIVDLVMLFMDDPRRQPQFESFIQGKPVILFNGSTTASDVTPASRLILRQDQNNEAAIAYAIEHNITWLIHIDTDEIFYED